MLQVMSAWGNHAFFKDIMQQGALNAPNACQLCWNVSDINFLVALPVVYVYNFRPLPSLGTFRSEDDDHQEFSVMSMRIEFGGRHFSKCACSERKTRTTSPHKRKVVTLNPFTAKIQMLILLAHCHTFFHVS